MNLTTLNNARNLQAEIVSLQKQIKDWESTDIGRVQGHEVASRSDRHNLELTYVSADTIRAFKLSVISQLKVTLAEKLLEFEKL